MKKLFLFLAVGLLTFLLLCIVFAQNDRWNIYRDRDSIETKRQFDPDPSNKYRGYIESDRSVKVKNYDDDTLRGYIDSDGYGTVHDSRGNTFQVRPR